MSLNITIKIPFRPKYISKDLKAILEASPRFVLLGEELSIEDNNVKVQ